MIWHQWIYGGRIKRLRDGQLLTKGEHETLFAHLRACTRCRRDYDLAMGTDRLLASRGASASLPTPAMLDALAVRVMPSEAPNKRPMPWLVPALASAVAAMLIAVVLMQTKATDEFTPRQGEDASFVVRAFCSQPQAAPTALEQTPAMRCPPGAMYRFAYTSKEPCDVELVAWSGTQKTTLGPVVSVPASQALRPLAGSVAIEPTVDRLDITCKNGSALRVITLRLGAAP